MVSSAGFYRWRRRQVTHVSCIQHCFCSAAFRLSANTISFALLSTVAEKLHYYVTALLLQYSVSFLLMQKKHKAKGVHQLGSICALKRTENTHVICWISFHYRYGMKTWTPAISASFSIRVLWTQLCPMLQLNTIRPATWTQKKSGGKTPFLCYPTHIEFTSAPATFP